VDAERGLFTCGVLVGVGADVIVCVIVDVIVIVVPVASTARSPPASGRRRAPVVHSRHIARLEQVGDPT